ncbi:hypothetical protein A3F66_00800 [candidate division TM6 bacterium RIFCSPHIGHO2_12_FULL_32_22]|nr:MAG: hypothetical protein A3F66_00800 [candidate division TM6 bacterium RIFCSPHIGHO2_12_FULL_32_22]
MKGYILINLIIFKLFSVCDGLCIVPVADLLKKSAKEIFGESVDIKEAYRSLLMGDVNCKREYQILYNELVEIIQVCNEEVQIRVPHIIYFDPEQNLYTNVYWTLKENLACLFDLISANVDLNKIPEEISFNQEIIPDKSIIVLKEPIITDENLAFSAGTRFKIAFKNYDHAVYCYFLNKNLEQKVLKIPRYKINFYEDKDIDERILDFVKLLRGWANLKFGFIPYLYSGSSFIYPYFTDTILERENDKTFYKDELEVYPYVGFDCSCIISRGAQICNLPYFYKDSITLERNLEQLTNFSDLKNSDIIWFPGHVVIVSDVENNLVLEARGYASGFGRVHECHINRMFGNINSFYELFNAKKENKKLKLLTKDGGLRYLIKDYKILSLKSGLYKEFKSLYNPVSQLDTSKCYRIN